MDEWKPPEGGAERAGACGSDLACMGAAELLAETERVVRGLLVRVRAGEFGAVRELAAEQAQLRRAWLASIQERQTVERYSNERGADIRHAPLDLARARDEIGRRLDRLRGAGGEGGVS